MFLHIISILLHKIHPSCNFLDLQYPGIWSVESSIPSVRRGRETPDAIVSGPSAMKTQWASQIRVSTKWLYFLRKICAIFAQLFFLRTFAQFLRKKRNEFCAALRIFFAQFAQNRKYNAKRNLLSKLSNIDILSKELTTEDLFNYYIQKKIINIWI